MTEKTIKERVLEEYAKKYYKDKIVDNTEQFLKSKDFEQEREEIGFVEVLTEKLVREECEEEISHYNLGIQQRDEKIEELKERGREEMKNWCGNTLGKINCCKLHLIFSIMGIICLIVAIVCILL